MSDKIKRGMVFAFLLLIAIALTGSGLTYFEADKDTWMEVGFFLGVIYCFFYECVFGILEDEGYWYRGDKE